jgi:hypothetical protein
MSTRTWRGGMALLLLWLMGWTWIPLESIRRPGSCWMSAAMLACVSFVGSASAWAEPRSRSQVQLGLFVGFGLLLTSLLLWLNQMTLETDTGCPVKWCGGAGGAGPFGARNP